MRDPRSRARHQTRIALQSCACACVIVWIAACASSSPLIQTETLRICPPASLAERPALPTRRDSSVGSLAEAYAQALAQLRDARERADELAAWLIKCDKSEDQ